MKILVIYDSIFGNTEKIAQAIGNALGAKKDVQVVKVSTAINENLKGLDLLFVGSPTRGFRPTEGISTFIKNIPEGGLNGIKTVAFDTRIPLETIKSKVFRFIVLKGGYAGPAIAKRLVARGAKIISEPEGFFVKDSEGPLVEGELERAATWAKALKRD